MNSDSMKRTLIRRAPLVVAAVLVVVVPAQLFIGLGRRAPAARPADRAHEVLPGPALPERFPFPNQAVPSPSPTKQRPAPSSSKDLSMFGGLGAWVDLFDFEALDPVASVADMRARGVRTLYLQTGRYNTVERVVPQAGPWLQAAHDVGLQVVGWYLPGYRSMQRDLRRTLEIASYDYLGHRFDALAIDIEYKGLVRDPPRWNARVVEHAEAVRASLGQAYPIAAIVPPPLQMDVAPLLWAGFPWEGIAGPSDVVMLMSYWSFRRCPEIPDHCALPFTQRNIEITRSLIGVERPIHTIGGVGDSVNAREIADFVTGAKVGAAFGASIYDYRTTKEKFWASLLELASL